MTRCGPVRVLHVFQQMERGGAELRTISLLPLLDGSRIESHFCALSGEKGPLDSQIIRHGGQVHYIRLGPRFFWEFPRLLRARQIDVVHAHTHMFSGLILALAAAAGVSSRIAHFRTTHDGHAPTVRRLIQRKFTRSLVDRFATKILAVSAATMRDAWATNWHEDPRCQIVYNGLEMKPRELTENRAALRSSLGIPPDTLAVLHVGRMDLAKNHRRVVEIFSGVAARREAHLYLLGRSDAQILRDLENLASELGIGPKISFLGQRENVAAWMDAADVMLFPSKWEGLPGAVLEASYRGLPVVASALPVMAEIKAHAPDLVTINLDAPDEEWEAAILALVRRGGRPGQRDGAAAVFRSGPFSLAACSETLERIWQESRSGQV